MKIVTVSDLIKILDTKENRYGGATGKPRMLNLSLNGNFAGSIESVKLDGYGDGLIADVTMEITASKFTTTNADRIRSMSDEELAEFLVGFKNTFGEEYEGGASCMEWLRLEAEQERKTMRLIDADKLLELIKDQKEREIGAYAKGINAGLNIVKSIINDETQTPIAYDVDKVVEQLKTDSSVKLYGSGNSNNYLISLEKAIEIVKAGGNS